jgi:N-acetylglucosaminyldiphosphoundecaprenol N-acetyl-beta-D-mannosaminyltransferase
VSAIYLSVVKRLLDLAVSLAASVVLLPLMALALLLPGVRLLAKHRVGRKGCAFKEYRLRCPLSGPGRFLERISFHRLPALWNILLGQMSFVGPRALKHDEPLPPEGVAHPRFSLRPGYVNPWWLRVRSNMTFDDEFAVDADYVSGISLKSDLGILVRSVLAAIYGRDEEEGEETLSLLGVHIANLTTADAVACIDSVIKAKGQQQVSFVNADSLNKAYSDEAFRNTLNAGDVVLGDGIGIKLGTRMTRQHIRENVNGTDLFPRLCEHMSREGQSLYLLGAKEGVPERVRDWVRTHHPGVNVVGARNGYFARDEEEDVCAAIRKARPDVLLVAFGAPRQESWIQEHLPKLNTHVAIGVGGLFDFYSGNTPRAPVWMREAGIEWVYRLIQEPRRMFKRYLVGNFVFVIRILKDRRGAEKKQQPHTGTVTP